MLPQRLFLLIIILVVVTAVIDLPKDFPIKLNILNLKVYTQISSPEIKFKLGNFQFNRDLNIRKGLDLQGGTHLVLQADMKDIKSEDRLTALDSAKEVINRRVDLYGVTEPLIQTSQANDDYQIIVELPGIQDSNQVIGLIGQTAQLDFRELSPEDKNSTSSADTAPLFRYQPTGLTGKDLQKASVQFSSNTGSPVVALQFTPDGAKKFAEITKRNVNFPVAIFLDQQPITVPKVNKEITNGDAIISGQFTVDEVKALAIQLNAGALPVP